MKVLIIAAAVLIAVVLFGVDAGTGKRVLQQVKLKIH
jgi:hypothetical protein